MKTSLYEILGVHANISQEGIKKAYQNLLRTEHPDKGGDEERFEQIRKAYSILSDPEKRKEYDRFGEEGLKESTEEDRFASSFGTLKAKERKDESTMSGFTQSLQTMDVNTIIKKEPDSSVGFEAWIRNKGERQIQMVTAETLVDKYGIETAGYDPIPLPPMIVHVVRYQTHGDPEQVLFKKLEPLPTELLWREVLVQMLAIPINPADFFSIEGIRDQTSQQPPYVAVQGNEGVGLVVRVGPGVENLHPQDWVVPMKVGLGTWRTMGVFREKDLWRIPADSISQEGAALLRPMCTAYRLLEDFVSLRPGDCILQNGANGAVGQAVIQICKVLRIQTINIVRERENWNQLADYLKQLGATVVLKPTDSISKAISDHNLGQPRLGLDCVGGQVAVMMANMLRPSSTLVVYGGTSRKNIPVTAPMLIFNDLSFRGFRLQKWIEDNPEAVKPMIDTISRLVKSGKCKIATKSFELGTDFESALVTALQEKRSAKVLLKVDTDIGEMME